MLFRTKINIVFLALSIVGGHVNAADAGYVAQAKQKARNARDWSVQVAGKARKKANVLYASTREKANALYEKAKENKLITAGLAYVALEAILNLSGKHTLFGRVFLLPGELDGLNANIVNLQNAVNAHPGAILNLNNAHQQAQQNALQNQLENLTAQHNNQLQDQIAELNNAHDQAIEELRQQHQQELERQRNQPGLTVGQRDDLVLTHEQAIENLRTQHEQNVVNVRNQLNAALENAQEQARLQQANLQSQLETQNISHLETLNEYNSVQANLNESEQQNEFDRTGFTIVMKNIGAQIGQLNGHVRSKEELIQQGRTQHALDQRHDDIKDKLDKLALELQSASNDDQCQSIDTYGIINDLMTQKQELIDCQKLLHEAYNGQQDERANVNGTFDTLVNLTQQTINHVINQIGYESKWLENNTKEMRFADITIDNFDQNITCVYSDINNYFVQMNNACDQLSWIVDFSNTNETIKFCLDRCVDSESQSDSIVQSLGAMMINSIEKVRQLLHHADNNCIVNSYDDAFNLYVHSLVATSAYESYSKFCSMMPNPELLEWAKLHEETIVFINNTILTGAVQVREASVDGMSSMLGNSGFLNTLNNSMISMLQNSGLNHSSINNFDLDAFLANPIEDNRDTLQQSWIKSGFGNSSIISFNNEGKMDDLDALLNLVGEKNDQAWEQEFNELNQSWNKSSTISNLTNSSLIQSNMLSSIMSKSMNLADESNLSSSVVQFTKNNALDKSCPFVPSDKWANQQDNLNQSGRFDNRLRFSVVPNFGPIGKNKSMVQSGVFTNKNNNSPKPARQAVGSLVSKFETSDLKSDLKPQVVKTTPKYTTSALINEFGGDSTIEDKPQIEKSGTFEPFNALLTIDPIIDTTATTSTHQ